MIWKKALKYPVLIVGIVLFGLYLTNNSTKEFWRKVNRRYKPSTCDVTMDRVRPKAPANWAFECETLQLLIINVDFKEIKNNNLSLRQEMYRELANDLKKLGHYSNLETLSFLKKVKMNIINKNLEVHSMTSGQAIVELTRLSDQQSIARHLKLTVKIKEVTK